MATVFEFLCCLLMLVIAEASFNDVFNGHYIPRNPNTCAILDYGRPYVSTNNYSSRVNSYSFLKREEPQSQSDADELYTQHPEFYKTNAEIDELVADMRRISGYKPSCTSSAHETGYNRGTSCTQVTEPHSSRTPGLQILGESMMTIAPTMLETTRAVDTWPKRLTDPVYHCCCQSYGILVKPSTAFNEDNQEVTLIQSPNRQQTFYSESCQQQSSTCNSTCTCQPPYPYIYRAHVLGTPPVQKIKIPGSCKCTNTASASHT